MDRPSVRLSAAFFHLLPPFSNFFDLLRPSVTFTFAQFVLLRSFLNIPSLFSIVVDEKEQIDSDY
jgi:hypothetical protein